MLIGLYPFLTGFFARYGRRCFVLMLGFIFVIASHLMYSAAPKCKQSEFCMESAAPMVILSIGSAFLKISIFSSLQLVTNAIFYGTMISILVLFYNLGIVIGTATIGYTIDHQKVPISYYDTHLLLICAGCLGLMISTYVCMNDELTRGRLNASDYEDSASPKVESDDDEMAEETKDKVGLFDDLDLNYHKQKSQSKPLIFVKESHAPPAYSTGGVISDTDSELLEKQLKNIYSPSQSQVIDAPKPQAIDPADRQNLLDYIGEQSDNISLKDEEVE